MGAQGRHRCHLGGEKRHLGGGRKFVDRIVGQGSLNYPNWGC